MYMIARHSKKSPNVSLLFLNASDEQGQTMVELTFVGLLSLFFAFVFIDFVRVGFHSVSFQYALSEGIRAGVLPAPSTEIDKQGYAEREATNAAISVLRSFGYSDPENYIVPARVLRPYATEQGDWIIMSSTRAVAPNIVTRGLLEIFNTVSSSASVTSADKAKMLPAVCHQSASEYYADQLRLQNPLTQADPPISEGDLYIPIELFCSDLKNELNDGRIYQLAFVLQFTNRGRLEAPVL